MKKILSGMLMLTVAVSSAQVKNVAVHPLDNGEKFQITYDLRYEATNTVFSVQLVLESGNETSTTVEHVSGDVGNEVAPGDGKSIIWNAKAALVDYEGNINLIVLAAPAVQIETKTRRNKSYPVLSADPAGLGQSKIFLVGNKSSVEVSVTDDQKIKIPVQTRPGRRYQLRVESAGKVRYTNLFKVRRQTPWAVKALPLLVFAGIYYKIRYDKHNEPLPEPPLPEDLFNQ